MSHKYFALLLIIFVVFSCKQKQETKIATLPLKKPNIIFIVADDLGYGDLGVFGQKHFATPNLDRMAGEGMLLTQHYAGATVCAPSRSALMTGLHTGHTFVRGNKEVQPEGQYPLPDSILTIAEVLRDAGYVTGAFGKWGLGAPKSEGDPNRQGIDNFFGYNCQRLAHNFYTEYLWENQDTVFLEGNKNGAAGEYSHDVIHKKTMEFLEANKDTTFFLFMPYTIPHAELLVPEDEVFEKFKQQFPEDTLWEGTDDGPRYRKGPYGSQQNPKAAFAAMVTRLDQAVGEVLEKLNEYGIAENTLVIFTSDNGPHQEGGANPDFFDSNGIYRGYKRDLYEGGIRVPTIAWWPGNVKQGSTSGHISAFWDFFPTACEIAGVTPPERLDGISYLPALTGEGDQTQHDFLYWEFHERGGKQAVLQDNWKAVRLNVNDPEKTTLELYDLSKDPGEQNNLAATNPEKALELQKLMDISHVPSPVFKFAGER